MWQALTGLEFWFTPPPGTVVPVPSRPRMAALMIAVVLMTYWLMPLLTRRLAGWIYQARTATR